MRNRLIQIYLRRIKGLSLPRDLIRYAVKRNHNKIAVVDGKREISYDKLFERAKRLANGLLKLGLNKGDKLAILIYNCQEYFELRIATYLTGIVLVPLSWDLDLEDIIFILDDCEVKTFIYHPQILADKIEGIKENTQVRDFIPILKIKESGSYEDLVSQARAHVSKVKLKEDDLASINFSSGTTGRPKGVMLTQKNWSASFYNCLLNANMSLDEEVVLLHAIPFATAGSTVVLPSIAKGMKNIILDKFNLERIVCLIDEYKVTSLFLTPGWFISLLDFCRRKDAKLASLRGIIVGTDPLPAEKLKEGIDFFGPIIEIGYGMAEVLPPLCLLCSRDYLVKGKLNEANLLSVGVTLKGVRLKIIDEEGRQVPLGERGRIVLESATLSQGYWNNPELTQRHYKDGFFYSNDFGYMDEEGYLYILGRKRDILKKDNEGIIFAREIEEVLHRHPEILEAFVFGIDKGKIAACVSLRGDSKDVTPEELIKFCVDRLEKGKAPKTITVLSELPKNASGKIDRKLMKNG